MCLPMKSRSAFSTICYSLPLSTRCFLGGVCMGKYLTFKSTEWLLTDNIQHRYLMLLLVTHSSRENYSVWNNMIRDRARSCSRDATQKRMKPFQCNILQLMMITIAEPDASHEQKKRQRRINLVDREIIFCSRKNPNKSTICCGWE